MRRSRRDKERVRNEQLMIKDRNIRNQDTVNDVST